MPDIIPGDRPYPRASFTLGNRVRRALWGIAYAVLFRPTPRPMHAWRVALLRLFGAKIGDTARIYSTVRFWAPWDVVLGDRVGIAPDVEFYSMAPIKVGSDTTISQGTYLCAGTHDYTDPNFQLYADPIAIGEGVWVCAQAFVGPGVTVGDRAVVGARSVVTRDLPPDMVCAGNPCRPLKPRTMKTS